MKMKKVVPDCFRIKLRLRIISDWTFDILLQSEVTHVVISSDFVNIRHKNMFLTNFATYKPLVVYSHKRTNADIISTPDQSATLHTQFSAGNYFDTS